MQPLSQWLGTSVRPACRLGAPLCAVALGVGCIALVASCGRSGSVPSPQADSQSQSEVPVQSPNSGRDEHEALEAIVAGWQGTEAMSIYLSGKKVGYGVVERSIDRSEGEPRFKSVRSSRYRVEMFGQMSVSTSTTTEWYSLQGEGLLVRFESKTVEDETRTVVLGRLVDGRFEVQRTVAGETRSTVIDPPKATLRDAVAWSKFLGPDTAIGTAHEYWGLDEDAADFNRSIRDTLIAKVPAEDVGSGDSLYEVNSTSNGAVARLKLRSDGTVIFMRAGPMEGRSEPEAIARRLPGVAPDLTETSLVRVEKDLGERPEELREVVLRISGVNGFVIPSNPEQTVERVSEDEFRVRIRREGPTAPAEPLDEALRARYVQAEAGIEVDSELIRATASAIAGSVAEPSAKAALLQRWVFQSLDQEVGKESASALAILKQRAGDCTELARLFVALARASGLPAREVGGLIYANDGAPCYGWHAWAEVHDGVRWLGVDPTWNQAGLDAGHLLMQIDSENDSWLNVVGTMRIVVEEYTKSEP